MVPWRGGAVGEVMQDGRDGESDRRYMQQVREPTSEVNGRSQLSGWSPTLLPLLWASQDHPRDMAMEAERERRVGVWREEKQANKAVLAPRVWGHYAAAIAAANVAPPTTAHRSTHQQQQRHWPPAAAQALLRPTARRRGAQETVQPALPASARARFLLAARPCTAEAQPAAVEQPASDVFTKDEPQQQEASHTTNSVHIRQEDEDSVEDVLEERKRQLWIHFIAGGVAGAVSRTCTAPLDRLKMIFQSQAGDSMMGVVNGFKYMRDEGGFRSMWRGNGVNVLKITPESAIKFWAWDAAKSVLYSCDERDRVPALERFAAGAVAGVTAQLSIFPLEVIKTRLATARTGQYRGMLDCMSQMAYREGFRAFYRGLIPALIGVIPYAGIDLAVYEFLKTRVAMTQPNRDASVLVFLGCGAVSSMCGQFASYPLALVRTRLQAHPSNKNGMVQEFVAVIRRGGPRALYRGILVNFMKVVPAVSISYVIFEEVKMFLNEKYS